MGDPRGRCGHHGDLPAGCGGPAPVVTGGPATAQHWGQALQGGQQHALYRTFALMFALFLGTMGLPHVLVRFYTNPDGRAARRTALVVIGLVGLFYLAPSVYGMLGRLYTPELLMTGRTDAVVLLLPQALVGGAAGQWLTALVAAGAAAAFLATATGLTVTVAGVLSQDVVGRRVSDPILSFRIAAAAAVLVPLVLGLVAESLPLARAVSLAFAVAAATFSPLLLLGHLVAAAHRRRERRPGSSSGGVAASGAIVVSTAMPGHDRMARCAALPTGRVGDAHGIGHNGDRVPSNAPPDHTRCGPHHDPPAHTGVGRRPADVDRSGQTMTGLVVPASELVDVARAVDWRLPGRRRNWPMPRMPGPVR